MIPYFDIIIIGSGMSGLYSAYKIKQQYPDISFLILEKHKRKWIGGRTNNELFYGTEIASGAGIGRKDTNPLLIKLMNDLNIDYSEFTSTIIYSKLFTPVDIMNLVNKLKIAYKKYPQLRNKTFKEFFVHVLGIDSYNNFTLSAGYTDYEDADVFETLYNYGMDDNKGGWKGLHIPWKKLVEKLYHKIGGEHFKFSTEVTKIDKIKGNPCLFEITTSGTHDKIYYSNKVIIATTISGIKKLVPGASESSSLYQQIHGQPFLMVYAKFDKKSSAIMKKYAPNYIVVPGVLQKIIPINPDKGVYMIAYSDNKSAIALKNNLDSTPKNHALYCRLIEKALGIPENSLHIISIKSFYWPVGTHYYEPLRNFKNRSEFVHKAQHPEEGMLVVGEVVSRYQGWVEGALESVETGLTKKWIENAC
jgi:hypothetical protein